MGLLFEFVADGVPIDGLYFLLKPGLSFRSQFPYIFGIGYEIESLKLHHRILRQFIVNIPEIEILVIGIILEPEYADQKPHGIGKEKAHCFNVVFPVELLGG